MVAKKKKKETLVMMRFIMYNKRKQNLSGTEKTIDIYCLSSRKCKLFFFFVKINSNTIKQQYREFACTGSSRILRSKQTKAYLIAKTLHPHTQEKA